jgi:hypothetical protein
MQGLIFHTLKGKLGWSHLKIIHIDVYKIIEINYHKRLFCIFNKDHPYTLTIEYDEPKESIGFNYGINSNGGTTTMITREVNLTQQITKRYKTEMDVKNEMEEIKKKQQRIKLLKQTFVNQMIEMEKNET